MERMKRNHIQFIFIFLFSYITVMYAQDKGLVFVNNLRIRTLPSMQGETKGSISYKNNQITGLVTVYDKQGSRTILPNGVWDYWYKISKDKDEWVNAYYVALFPIYFRYNLTASGSDYIINNITTDGVCDYIKINGRESTHKIEYSEVLLHNLYNNPCIRLGEMAKDINAQLSDIYTFSDLHDAMQLDISNVNLPYGLRNGLQFEDIVNIIGGPVMGSEVAGFFDVHYPDKTFELKIYFNTYTGAVDYTYEIVNY